MNKVDVLSHLRIELALIDVSLDDLVSASRELVVFGSRACGCSTMDSDWDLLLIDGPRIRIAGMDIVNKSPSDPSSWKEFLSSELASHIKHFGIWAKGSGHWTRDVELDGTAYREKVHKVSRQMGRLSDDRTQLIPLLLKKWNTLVRRDIQRLDRLTKRVPTPASQQLDREYHSDPKIIAKIKQSQNSSRYRQFARLISEYERWFSKHESILCSEHAELKYKISDSTPLLRRIHPRQIVEVQDGFRPSPSAFTPDANGMLRFFIETRFGNQNALQGSRLFSLASIEAGHIRKLGLELNPDQKENDCAVALVTGKVSKFASREMAKLSTWKVLKCS